MKALTAALLGTTFGELNEQHAAGVSRDAARDLLTRVALGHETLASALVQLRKVDP